MGQSVANLVISIADDFSMFLEEYQGTEPKKKVRAVTTDFIVFCMQREDLREEETIGLLEKRHKVHTSELDKANALIALNENLREYPEISMQRIASKRHYGILGNQASLSSKEVERILLEFLEVCQQS